MEEITYSIDFIDNGKILTRVDNILENDLYTFMPVFVLQTAGWSVKTQEEIIKKISLIDINTSYVIAENSQSLYSVVVTKNKKANTNCIINIAEQKEDDKLSKSNIFCNEYLQNFYIGTSRFVNPMLEIIVEGFIFFKRVFL